jgi:lysylphosphatidylglycerol synthetase-like protein (DUF2156 family)
VNVSTLTPGRKAPWHLWVIAVLALLWNGSGAYTIMMAQSGRLSDLEPGEAAYYAAQPTWFVVITDVALVAAVVAAVALLLRSKTAVWLFALSLAAIFVTNGYELAAATSRILVSRGALIVTIIIVIIAILELAYAWALQRRAGLK